MNLFLAVTILALIAAGALIAWLGDIIGYRIGKSRRSLFGLRPRTTARLVGMVIGAILPLLGLAVAYVSSENVRIALLHLDDLRQRNRQLAAENMRLEREQQRLQQRAADLRKEARQAQREAASAREEAENAQRQARSAAAQLAAARRRLAATHRQLADARRRLALTRGQLAQARKRLEELRGKLTQAQNQVQELEKARQQLQRDIAKWRRRARQLAEENKRAQDQLAQARKSLAEAEQRRKQLEEQLKSLENRQAQLQDSLITLRTQRHRLEAQVQVFERQIRAYDEELGRYERQLQQARDAIARAEEELAHLKRRLALQRQIESTPVIFEPGNEIVRGIIPTDQARDQIISQVRELLVLADHRARAAGVIPSPTGRCVILVGPRPPGVAADEDQIVAAVADHIVGSSEPAWVVVVRAAERHFAAEPGPVAVEMWLTPQHVRFRKGEVIGTITIPARASRVQVLSAIIAARAHLRRAARARGLLPNPETGDYGGIAAEDILACIDAAAGAPKPVAIELYAAADTKTTDPLIVRLRIRR